MTVAAERKVLMICVDAVDLEFLEGHLAALPNFSRWFSEGQLVRLRSPGGELGASVWPTFCTGSLPGEHGYYFPLQWDPERMRLRSVGDDWHYVEPFWYPLARRDVPVVAFDVQWGFPSRLPSGFEVHNWSGQSFATVRSNRPALLEELVRRFGRHPMGEDVPATWGAAELRRMRASIAKGIPHVGRITRWLMERLEWRLFLTSFVECHRAGHYLWDVGDVPGASLLELVQQIEAEIADILAAVDLRRTTVIVFALHGMGPSFTQMHFMPEIIERINAAFYRDGSGAPRSPSRRRNLVRFLRRQVPSRIQGEIGQRTPMWLRDWVVGREFDGGFDWSRTPAFTLPCGGEGFIRFNMKGRERDGVLAPGSAETERYRRWVETCLRSLRNSATGAPLVREILYAAEAFPGARSHFLPDVIVLWQDEPPATEIASDLLGRMRARLATGRDGVHRSRGFAIVLGDRPDGTFARRPAHIADLAAWVRDMFEPSGRPMPVDEL